ncbi:carbohydrate ABC transporter permease [uncultured Brachyspira sp.]|uniref:carbohydrate ABC transporter permease n=1 Tax=uncultured Brachyspira sp. TaxID=221953 RepID=UPI002602E7D3|nr:sugar ABC transporter permease [uncultured Brachyspira sp.]
MSAKTKLSLNQMSYKNKEKMLAYILLSPVLIIYVLFIFYPVINGMINAFTDFSIYNNNPRFVFLDNFKELLSSPDFFVILIRTIVFVAITVAIQYVLGLAFALLLSLELPGTVWLRNFAMLPWVLPMTAAVLSFNWIFQADYGLLNIFLRAIGKPELVKYWFGDINLAFPAVVIIHVWRNVPFYGLVLYAGLKGIPKDLYEAADLDGASKWQFFRE